MVPDDNSNAGVISQTHNSGQAAIIEAFNDAKAIDFAREVADGEAQKFDCKGEPVEHRRGGKSPF